MYRDNTLIPTEAIRLAVLGDLLEGDKPYGELVRAVRHFVGRMAGPSLDLLGPSLELLSHEGLVTIEEGTDGLDAATVRILPEGRDAFSALMSSNVRAPVNDVSKLVIALKLRFLHMLEPERRGEQIEMLSETCQAELARLEDLMKGYGDGRLGDWLGLEIGHLKARLAWFEALQKDL